VVGPNNKTMMNKGKIYLIQSGLGDHENQNFIPSSVLEACLVCDVFLVEKFKTARRFLRSIGFEKDFDALEMQELSKHTSSSEKEAYLRFLLDGKAIGIISEAGCPGVADPGAEMVLLAHEYGFEVTPLVGPSSILLALMASGLNGQSFAFHGYLPIDKRERVKAIQQLENISRQHKQTQLFMETPYRNVALFDDLCKTLNPNTLLSISANLTQSDALSKTKRVSEWRGSVLPIHKKPAIFAILAGINY
jgi:16S rRNA (cytidine1402-2'-O)-methyltransferase